MICTRCYESSVLYSETKPIAKTNTIGVILALALLGMPTLGYPIIFEVNRYTGELEPNKISLAVAALIELIMLVAIYTIGRSHVCSTCRADALVPRASVRGLQIQAEAARVEK